MELMFLKEEEAVQMQAFIHKRSLSCTYEKRSGRFVFFFPKMGIGAGRCIDLITEYIIQVKRRDFLNKMLEERFHYKNEEEREQIIEIVSEMCAGKRDELVSLTGKLDEYEAVKQAVRSSFETSDAILFDSLQTFRLKEYQQAITKFLHSAIDEYKMEQEYQTFIQMLRDYLRQQQPKKKVVHLSFGDEVLFYNEAMEAIPKEAVLNMVDRRLLANHPLYIDSAVIAPLLSIAPEKIILYAPSEEKPLIRTLKNIFEERITILPLMELPK